MKYIFTVDIGGTKIKYGVIDFSGKLIYKIKCHLMARLEENYFRWYCWYF